MDVGVGWVLVWMSLKTVCVVVSIIMSVRVGVSIGWV